MKSFTSFALRLPDASEPHVEVSSCSSSAVLSEKKASLFDPVKIGDLELNNRFVMSAMTRNRNQTPGQDQVDYYTQRANAGLIVTEGVLVEPQGTEWPEAPGIWNDEQVAGWKKVTDSVHQQGGKIFCQLWHLGRINHPWLQAGQPIWAPSAVAAKGGKFRQLAGNSGYVMPREIPDPSTFVQLYKQAAINAKRAGFDGVEVHCANGYLPHQFLEKHSNRRQDKYGGSAVNRTRFPLEVVDAAISVFGAGRVGVKISPGGGYNDMGMPIEDLRETYSLLVKEFDKRKLGYVCIMRRLEALDPAGRGTPFDVKELASQLKHAKVMLNGGYDAKQGQEGVESGVGHLIAFGRPYIANPDLVRRYREGLELNALDFTTLYGGRDGKKAVGYSDYLPYEAAKAAGQLESQQQRQQ